MLVKDHLALFTKARSIKRGVLDSQNNQNGPKKAHFDLKNTLLSQNSYFSNLYVDQFLSADATIFPLFCAWKH